MCECKQAATGLRSGETDATLPAVKLDPVQLLFQLGGSILNRPDSAEWVQLFLEMSGHRAYGRGNELAKTVHEEWDTGRAVLAHKAAW